MNKSRRIPESLYFNIECYIVLDVIEMRINRFFHHEFVFSSNYVLPAGDRPLIPIFSSGWERPLSFGYCLALKESIKSLKSQLSLSSLRYIL